MLQKLQTQPYAFIAFSANTATKTMHNLSTQILCFDSVFSNNSTKHIGFHTKSGRTLNTKPYASIVFSANTVKQNIGCHNKLRRK